MILIIKAPQPGELMKYRKDPHASYDSMPRSIKKVVKAHLIAEQSGLCAYCMRRLPEPESLETNPEGITIEHWSPQNPLGGMQHDPLDYQNMLAVCTGNRDSKNRNYLTCDAARGNEPLYVNPLDKSTLADIYYESSSGAIHSTNADAEKDLDHTLNLNDAWSDLPQNRKAALDAFLQQLNRKYKNKQASNTFLKKQLESFEKGDGRSTPYVGIIIWYIKKRIKI